MRRVSLILHISVVIFLISLQVELSKSKKINEENDYDKCADMCHRIYPKESLKHQFFGSPRNACQQGCELITHLQTHAVDFDFGSSSRICQRDCLRIYDFHSERFACNLGCFGRLIPPASGTPHMEWYPQNSEDIEPDDVLLDPALRTQLKADESPLPHLHIKTLPRHHLQSVEELYQQFMEQETLLQDPSVTTIRKFWYDYFVTRMVLAAAIMLSVMCALWLCLVPHKNGLEDGTHQSDSLESVSHKCDDSTSDPPKYSDIEFHPPTPPPPKYSEVVSETV